MTDGYSGYTDPTTIDNVLDNDDELFETVECSLEVQLGAGNFTVRLHGVK